MELKLLLLLLLPQHDGSAGYITRTRGDSDLASLNTVRRRLQLRFDFHSSSRDIRPSFNSHAFHYNSTP